MNNKRTGAICITLAAAAILTFFASYAFNSGKNEKPEVKEPERRQTVKSKTDVEESALPSQTTAVIHYSVKLDGEKLTLYEVNGESFTPIKSISIDTSYYPQEDITSFLNGVDSFSLESGFEILENFSN